MHPNVCVHHERITGDGAERKNGKQQSRCVSPYLYELVLCNNYVCLSLQYFNKKFTNNDLKKYISTKPKKIRVHGQNWSKGVKIKLGRDKQALLTTKWLRAVEREALGVGNVVIFDFCWFKGRLKLFVAKIMRCDVCANA